MSAHPLAEVINLSPRRTEIRRQSVEAELIGLASDARVALARVVAGEYGSVHDAMFLTAQALGILLRERLDIQEGIR